MFPHEPLQQPKCKQCHAQLAIGGKPTTKKGKKCKVCGNINHLNCRTCKHFPLGVSIHWTGLLEWNAGLDYMDLKANLTTKIYVVR